MPRAAVHAANDTYSIHSSLKCCSHFLKILQTITYAALGLAFSCIVDNSPFEVECIVRHCRDSLSRILSIYFDRISGKFWYVNLVRVRMEPGKPGGIGTSTGSSQDHLQNESR